MKKGSFIALLFSAVLAMAFSSGCASTPNTDLLTGILSDAAAIVLTKNQKAVPIVRSLSAGLELALTKEAITPAQIKAFIEQLDQNGNLTTGERLLLGRGIQRTQKRLTAVLGTPDINVKDPRVRGILEEIKRNLDETLALHDALKA
jgi:hypothetical protein